MSVGKSDRLLDWKREHPKYADLPDAIWLHCVLYEATLARRRTSHLRFARLELPPTYPLSGNIVVRDVLICTAARATPDLQTRP